MNNTKNTITEIRKMLEVFLKLKSMFPDIMLGGSVALMLMGRMTLRTPKDLDIVTSNKSTLKAITLKNQKGSIASASEVSKTGQIDGVNVDVFYQENPKRETVEFQDVQYPALSRNEIVMAKMRYALKGGIPTSMKHKKDLVNYLTLELE